MSLPNPPASRRTTMTVGLAGLLAVAACDSDPGGAAPAADPTTEPPDDADAALVERVRTELLSALAAVEAARRAAPGLRRGLRPFADLHRAHLVALDSPADPELDAPATRPSAEVIRKSESALQRGLADAAVRAESGTLAKLFASMSAAVAQQLAVPA